MLEICARIAERVPVVPMVYANMVLARGAERFARELADAGAGGVIVPDLPVEETAEIAAALRAAGLALVPLVAPTTPHERRARICAAGEGFVYVVSTRVRPASARASRRHSAELIEAARADSPHPVAVGFGIGTPEQAAAVGGVADGVIIGSRLVRAVAEAGGAAEAARAVGAFLADTRAAISTNLPAA